jgi:hypothetical protein
VSPDETLTRTRERVDREYGQEKWPAVEQLVDEHIAREQRFDRVLGRVAREQWRRADSLATRPFVAGGETVPLPLSGAYGAGQGVLLELLSEACGEQTDLIVELGAGWGWHILTLWARGGPRDATYVSAELTEAGRRAAAKLAALDPDLDFQTRAFDYHEPALDFGDREHAVVFTAHSIEQVPQIRPELFASIRGLARHVTCLHFEPVGWQLEDRDLEGSSRAYAERHDYNRNLVETIRAEEAAGRIRVEAIRPDLFGIVASNASTLIRWSAGA